MPDYKELFYKSQAELADAIDKIEELKNHLIGFVQYCEDKVIEEDKKKQSEKKSHSVKV